MSATNPRVLLYAENADVGGAERYLRDVANHLMEHGFEARIGCNDNPHLLAYWHSELKGIPVDALPVHTVVESAAFRASRQAEMSGLAAAPLVRVVGNAAVRLAHFGPDLSVLYRWIRQHRPDVLHINNGGYPGGESCRVAAMAGWLAGVPAITMTVHSIAAPPLWPVSDDVLLDRLISKSVGSLFAVSRATADALVYRRGFPRGQVVCVPNGVDVPHWEAVPEKTRRALGLPREGLLIGAVGRLDENKGQGVLLGAAADVCRRRGDVYVVLVGSGPSEAEYRALAQGLGITQRVIFTGQRSDVLDLLRAFDIFVMPTVGYEGLPYALLEAMSVGLPVVATRVGGMPEVIQPGETGVLVEPRDVEGLSTVLLRLLSNPEDRRRLGVAARDRVAQEYSVECMVRRIVNEYDHLLGLPDTGGNMAAPCITLPYGEPLQRKEAMW